MGSYEDLGGFPAGQLLVACMFIAAARALWLRRSTWRIPWEIAATLNVALQTAEIVLISGPVSRWLGPRLHTLTGLWNMEDFVGHLAYIAGMVAFTYMVLSRLDMSDKQFARYIRPRLEIPAMLFVPLAATLFVAGGFASKDVDIVLMPPTLGSRIYMAAYVIADVYLLARVIPALMIIRRDVRQKGIATVYLGAVGISAATCVVILIGFPPLVWAMIRAETGGYAVAACYSWSVRSKHLRPKCPS